MSNPNSKIGKLCNINWSVSFCGTTPITVGKKCDLRHCSILSPGHGSILIGENSSIGAFNYIDGNGDVEIGDNVRIGPHCAIYSANHTFDDITKNISSQSLSYGKVTLENNIWIGSHAVILAGVTIGEGSVIAAGFVVNRDVPPYSIVAGVPAKVIKYRK